MAPSPILLLLLLLAPCWRPCGATDCGQTAITASLTAAAGVIRSPNHPADYGPESHCVWRITGPDQHAIRLSLPSFHAEAAGCRDFLEVRDGTRKAALLLRLCNTTVANATVQSTNRYLWLRFRSNYAVQGAGFAASWSLVRTGRASPALSDPSCRPTEWSCTNGQCANWSGLCDAFEDCGCGAGAAGCDEDPWRCGGNGTLSGPVRVGVGVALGVAAFWVTFAAALCWERGICGRAADAVGAWCAKRRCRCRCRCPDRDAGASSEEEEEEAAEEEEARPRDPLDCGVVDSWTDSKRVTIVVHPGLSDRRPRYSVVAFPEAVLASHRVAAYLPGPDADGEVRMLDPAQLLAQDGEAPAYGVYGTAQAAGRRRQRRRRRPTARPGTERAEASGAATPTAHADRQKARRRTDAAAPVPVPAPAPAPVFRQIKRPTFPVHNYV